MRKVGKLFLLSTIIGLLSVPICIATPFTGSQGVTMNLLPGIGTAYPQALNVSKDPARAEVYEWKINHERVFQVNSPEGSLMGFMTVTLPGQKPMVSFTGQGLRQTPLGGIQPKAAGTCPCTTEILSAGNWDMLIGIVNSSGALVGTLLICDQGATCSRQKE